MNCIFTLVIIVAPKKGFSTSMTNRIHLFWRVKGFFFGGNLALFSVLDVYLLMRRSKWKRGGNIGRGSVWDECECVGSLVLRGERIDFELCCNREFAVRDCIPPEEYSYSYSINSINPKLWQGRTPEAYHKPRKWSNDWFIMGGREAQWHEHTGNINALVTEVFQHGKQLQNQCLPTLKRCLLLLLSEEVFSRQ